MFLRLIIFLARIQPATRAIPQKELIIQNTKLLLKMIISNLKKTWTNTALFEFSLAKSDIRQRSWPKVKFKDNFITIFDFNLPFFKALSKDGKIINLNNIQVIFISYFLQYSKVHYYTQFHKTLWDHAVNPWEKPGTSNAKIEQWLISPGKPRAINNMHYFYDLSNWCCE